jgi:molecular chaperone HtpG
LIPEYLTLLKGMIDCPDLPLNVSRSALQADPQVRKIAQHITKKVADKLSGMCKVERADYEGYWEDINPFIKYAMMRDSAFMDRMKDFVIFKTTAGTYTTVPEYLEKFGTKSDQKIIYCADPAAQSHFVKMVRGEGLECIICNRVLDQHFIPYLEMQNPVWKFQRVDSDIEKYLDSAKTQEIVDPTDNQTASQKLEQLFRSHLSEQPDLAIRIETLRHTNSPAVMVLDENMRRLKEMSKSGQLGAFAADFGAKPTLVINRASPAVKRLLELNRQFNRTEDVKLMVSQIYDLAAIQQGQFNPEAMQGFLERSISLLARVGGGISPEV